MIATTKRLSYLFFSFFILISFYSNQVIAQSLSLYTPITKITVPPGQEINYNIDVINNSSSIKTSSLNIVGLPQDWNFDLKSGGWNVEQISVLPNNKEKLSLKVTVPVKINKGTYRFKVLANGYSVLPLTVTVSKQGTYQTTLTSEQPNIEGASNTTFTYNANLKNGTTQSQVYALKASPPSGWFAIFKANGKQVSSVNVEANQTQRITIELKPSENTKSGLYKIPITAQAENFSARLELETVITGSYSLSLSTPTGLLSTDVTAGEHKKLKLLLKNTGSAALNKINLKARTPSNWSVDFTPKEIPFLEAGKTEEIEAIINVHDKALSGDYETNFDAKASETSTLSKFRITVHASILSGWFGFFIIIIALGCVYYLIRKYGRR
ncbi:hypothetical protein APS56_06770 [Pseudalgibacter alginicilyticus]|uniref:Alpha-galactosidase NEW3 domain-containing protein n=1 Tax=Pseudalgibacter alginicilyticus TaxID=1736674 RepID=A0A0P0CWG2_9FLAO|nr:NEW3 domain-containing protein [Pseudalgibacter alginicilyticus]ALJ04842.1 hypothetical protein APS56_06770 [Pseudalgibacter alginicilyticus]